MNSSLAETRSYVSAILAAIQRTRAEPWLAARTRTDLLSWERVHRRERFLTLVDLVAANSKVRARAASNRPGAWHGSQFQWLKALPNRLRGAAGSDIFAQLMRRFGYRVTSGAIAQSFIVKGQTVKVKMSMMWANSSKFVFQQIEDGSYDYLAMLGIEPAGGWLWICPKSVARRGSRRQHAQDSRWIRFTAGKQPKWMKPYGGSIQRARTTVRAQLGAPP